MTSIIVDSNQMINNALKPLMENTPLQLVFKMILILYATAFAPKLGPNFSGLLSNPFFRVIVLSLIVWIYSKDPVTSVLIAVCYYVSISYLTKNSLGELIVSGNTPQITHVITEAPVPVPTFKQIDTVIQPPHTLAPPLEVVVPATKGTEHFAFV